jgi:hypothetical protein
MQDERGLSSRSLDVNVRRSMIVRANDHPQPVEAKNRRHCRLVAKPKRFGKSAASSPLKNWAPGAAEHRRLRRCAVAKARCESLLFKGRDFLMTDVQAAI